ncbi:MAG: hypothetical protein F4226_02975 [Synechococcus sp. SB0678_bin_12]|nr:hypothetical protein [Synechococcus sp. SB0678_bin_12]
MNRSLAQLLAAPAAAGMLFLMPAGIAQDSQAGIAQDNQHLLEALVGDLEDLEELVKEVNEAKDDNSVPWVGSAISSLLGSLIGSIGIIYFLLKDTRAKVEIIKEDIAKLNHEGVGNLKTDLKDKINSLEDTIKTVSTELQSQVKDVNNAIEKIQEFIPEINKAYEQIDSKIDSKINKFNADFSLSATMIKTEIIELDNKISNKIIDLKDIFKDSLNTSQEKLEISITKLKSGTQKLANDQIPELRKAVKGIEINVKDIEIDMKSIKDRLDTLDT